MVAADGKLRDLEVLSIWSNHINKTSEETADKEQTAAGSVQCALLGAVLAAEAAKAAEAAEVDKEKVATIATEEAAAAAGRQQHYKRLSTKGMLEMRAVQQDRKKTTEKAEDKAERLRKSLVESMW